MNTIKIKNCKKDIIAEALVSQEDYDNVNKYTWSIRKKNKQTYVHGWVNGIDISMHQFIIGKAKKGYVIDHKNNNGLDNQRCNLRFISYSANSQNKKKKENTINN